MQVGFVQVFTFQYEKINTKALCWTITLCFRFTFQYEKINTDDILNGEYLWKEFTFQYEKINTHVQERKGLHELHLHSNMKRLIPIAFFALSLKRYFAIICRPF